jgi:hypothetical protein
MWQDMERSGHDVIEMLSLKLFGGTGDNHKKLGNVGARAENRTGNLQNTSQNLQSLSRLGRCIIYRGLAKYPQILSTNYNMWEISYR